MYFLKIAKNMLPFSRYPYEGRRIPCPVCTSGSFQRLCTYDRRLKRLPTVVCTNCGLIYTNPMPTEDELAVYYEHFYRFDYQLAVGRPSERHIKKRKREAENRIGRIARHLVPGARTLDFGAGSGEFVAGMVARGYDAHGFEPGQTYATFAQEQLGDRISLNGWRQADYDQPFDLVTAFHVVEHLNDPLAAFARIASWLKPGGLAYIEVPNALRWAEAKGFGSFHFAHVVGFNQYNLELVAAKLGFRTLDLLGSTSIIFRLDHSAIDEAQLARKGVEESQRCFDSHPPVDTFFRYQLSKIGVARRSA